MKKDRIRHITVSMLKARGWTESLIRCHLGPPDDKAQNPHYRRAGAPMRLYRLDRVETLEARDDIRAALNASLTQKPLRSRAARAAVETKTRRLVTEVADIFKAAPILRLDQDVLIKAACDHYNQRGDRSRFDPNGDDLALVWRPASLKSDPQFLERITVNYIRHVLTDYDCVRPALKGLTGKEAAAAAVKKQILASIAVAYPWLATECERQASCVDSEGRPPGADR